MSKRTKKKTEAPAPKPFLCEWQCHGIITGTRSEFRGYGKMGSEIIFLGMEGVNRPIDATLPIPANLAALMQNGMTLKIRVEAFA